MQITRRLSGSPVYRMKIKTQYINSSTPVQLIIFNMLVHSCISKDSKCRLVQEFIQCSFEIPLYLKIEIQRACRVYIFYLV